MSREKPKSCDCCDYETASLTQYTDQMTTIGGGGGTRRDDFWYCDLCAMTPASTKSRYPNYQPSNMQVIQTVCLVGNKIIDALRATSTVNASEAEK